MGESRQVIQVPGAPPISIRFGPRPGGSQPPHDPGNARQVTKPVSYLVMLPQHLVHDPLHPSALSPSSI